MPPQDIRATIHPLYAVPLMEAHLPGAERINRELAGLFLALEAEGDRHRDPIQRDTQYGLFESNFHLHRRTEPAVQELFAFIRQALYTLIQGLNRYSDAQMANLELDMHSWFHVTRTHGFQGLHDHPNASWSAIYCVDPGDPGPAYSGAVRFHDPRAAASMHRDPGNENMQVPYRLGSWQLNHKAGQLIAFPSYLLHEVFPYAGQRPRIIVALNAWCRWKTPGPERG
ncbi:putative 2OG-Fe(II) oxygenase [Pseudoxanthomonas taiwanensis]|jgi:hypothetical protein|uniref:Fe2OG dioxygenase domain-containing protein n=1 Tax=Pseudoxanthomonas taiwanensis TaxID=176598 RepID=A0A921NV92_9GAMM|nr:putative 2OG-Fe(II) oxygenase [Pseudoxanthomonas taiwanensis]KAF1690833.1 hypothetical protein CR938_00990 [Pseudoxanthomonas taiwanensis]MBO2468537.1 hypothetical protein [Xanthomonadaceae bacterium]